MSKAKQASGGPREIRNNKVHRNYFIGDTFEAGIKLTGTEIKSIRAGKAQINEAFVRVEKNEVPTLYHAHVDEYSHGSDNNHNPVRPRVLLLHKREIIRLKMELEAGGQALIPTKIYFKGGLAKIQLALCKGKKLFDKREDIKRKTELREAERAIKGRYR